MSLGGFRAQAEDSAASTMAFRSAATRSGLGSQVSTWSAGVTPDNTNPKSKSSSAASSPSVAGRSPTTILPGVPRSSPNRSRTRFAIGAWGFPAIMGSVLPATETAAVNEPLPGSNPCGVGYVGSLLVEMSLAPLCRACADAARRSKLKSR